MPGHLSSIGRGGQAVTCGRANMSVFGGSGGGGGRSTNVATAVCGAVGAIVGAVGAVVGAVGAVVDAVGTADGFDAPRRAVAAAAPESTHDRGIGASGGGARGTGRGGGRGGGRCAVRELGRDARRDARWSCGRVSHRCASATRTNSRSEPPLSGWTTRESARYRAVTSSSVAPGATPSTPQASSSLSTRILDQTAQEKNRAGVVATRLAFPIDWPRGRGRAAVGPRGRVVRPRCPGGRGSAMTNKCTTEMDKKPRRGRRGASRLDGRDGRRRDG